MTDTTAAAAAAPAPDEAIVVRYRAADAKGKAKIRTEVKSAIGAAVIAGNITLAQTLVATEAALVTVRAAAAAADPADIIARRVASLRLAADMIASGVVRPDGTPDDFTINSADIADRVKSIMAAAIADQKAGTQSDGTKALSEASTKLATAKITRSTDTHDIAEWITRALASVEINRGVTVAQIITLGAIEGDDYRPTSGAVTARLNSKNTIEGVVKCAVGDRGVVGAMRTA